MFIKRSKFKHGTICYYKYVIVSVQEFERDGICKRFLANKTYMEDSLMFSIAPL